MKEEKSGDKATRPMFPMLHLKYADIVGPRAPPRNKMALYEQLSIPFHGSSSTTLSPHKPGTILKSTPSSQDGSHERTSYPSFCQPHSQLIPSAEKPYFASSNVKHMKTMESARRSTWVDFKPSFVAGSGDEGSSFNARDYLSEHNYFKLKSDVDDYFKVATLVQSTNAPHSNAAFVLEANMPAPSGASSISKAATFNSIIQSTTSDPSESSLAAADRGTEIQMRCVERKGYQSTRIEKESFNIGSVKVLRSFDGMKIPESRIVSKMRSGSCSETLPGNCHISYDDKETELVDFKDTDRNNEAPEATMVDLISGLNISLNDVVGVLGSKKFWKVRRAIVNQQRVFAIQVFELHRVIKVS